MVGRILVGLVGLTGCALVSCSSSGGGSGGGGACGTVAPCGGDVVGTWKASDVCITGETTSMTIMPGCTVMISATPHLTGSATFTSTGTFTSDSSINITTTIAIPAGCLSTTLTCQTIGPAIAMAVGAGASAACSTAGGGCTCTLTEPAQTSMSSGTYATSGDAITTTDSTGTSAISSGNYCVTGNGSTLHLISTSTGTGADGGATTSNVDVVLTK